MAGYFESYSNVSSNDKSLINENIEKLFDSYVVNSKIDNKNEVLVQEYIINSKVSGVVFTSLIGQGHHISSLITMTKLEDQIR